MFERYENCRSISTVPGLAVVISMMVAAISGCALACGPIAVNGLTLLNSPDGVSTP
jgi:hypothetical protein